VPGLRYWRVKQVPQRFLAQLRPWRWPLAPRVRQMPQALLLLALRWLGWPVDRFRRGLWESKQSNRQEQTHPRG